MNIKYNKKYDIETGMYYVFSAHGFGAGQTLDEAIFELGGILNFRFGIEFNLEEYSFMERECVL